MTGTVMPAHDLLTNSDFLGFCRCWARDYRIPLGLPDWLREQGLDKQAAVADWCLSEPDRQVNCATNFYRCHDGGPTPSLFSPTEAKWGWWFKRNQRLLEADDLPGEPHNKVHDWIHPTFEHAIVALLEYFEP